MTENEWIIRREDVVPGNAKDRVRFAALTSEERGQVKHRVAVLYDGTRTIAACWKLALAEAGAR